MQAGSVQVFAFLVDLVDLGVKSTKSTVMVSNSHQSWARSIGAISNNNQAAGGAALWL